MLGIIFGFSHTFKNKIKKSALVFTLFGILAGGVLFGVRLYDPKGMNLILMAFNRKLVVTIAGVSLAAVALTLLSSLVKNEALKLANLLAVSILVFVSLFYLVPPVLQYTREFVYFGEAGISTNAMLRALGFALGLCVCLLLTLSAYEVHKSLRSDRERNLFMLASLVIFACEYMASAVAALQRLKVLRTSDAIFNITVFDVMIWRGEIGRASCRERV